MNTFTKPNLGFWKLWNLSFGFFGVQIAYALQSANISRIFATLGADPHNLSYFWILPPLMGIIVQPLVGAASDRTWNRLGRRLPYLLLGAAVAIIVMCLLPNAGSFGLTIAGAMTFGFITLMFLDTSINMAMQPFKMLVGDMVNEKQKGLAYSIQSFLCNAGSLVGYLAPITLTAIGISNLAPAGQVPDTVTYSFYIGAAVLVLCVIYSFATIREMPPAEYARFHGITQEQEKESSSLAHLLKHAPKTFWTVGLVQFFCWAAFMYMWTYTNGAIAHNVWGNFRHCIGRISGGRQLGGSAVCSAGSRLRAVGSGDTDVPQPQSGLFAQPCARRNRIYLGIFHHQSIRAVRVIFPDRVCMGGNARDAVYHSYQLAFGQEYGYVSRIV